MIIFYRLENIIPQGFIKIARYTQNKGLKEFMEKNAVKEFDYLKSIIDNDQNHKLRLEQSNKYCRYRSIITYKDNRVVLHSTNRYINASWIHIPLFKYFIATQGPLPHTIIDFWTMCDEYNVSLIVMLCNLKENNVDKCADYWHVQNLGHLRIKLLEEKEDQKGIFIRRISLFNKLKKKEKIFIQIHLTYWEDHKALDGGYFNKIIRIIQIIDGAKKKSNNPCVVHCSAGVGRTGTFISLYNLYHEIIQQIFVTKNEVIVFCIFNLVRKMKEMRIFSIENENQFLLIYDFANYLLYNYNRKNK